jgi:ribosome biogenesis GTPase
LGYGILDEYRSRGYATEAVKLALEWAFEQSGVNMVEAETDPENTASQKVLFKCGFIPNGKNGEEGPRFAIGKEKFNENKGNMVCRVVMQEKGQYRISGPEGEQWAKVSGRFRYETGITSDFPAVGDYVMVKPANGGVSVIHAVLPRKSVFIRKAAGTGNTNQVIAANIDIVFLCMALNNDFNIRRMERYLTVAWDSGATPVILLTKKDLCDDLDDKIIQIESIAPGVDIITSTSMEEDGIKQIEPYLEKGKTFAFVGSSGVGKSTLINRLLKEDRLETNGLRNDDRGRHTTTHREMIFLSCGAIVIDTPGMRELGMWAAETGLSTSFADVEALAEKCRFRDCTHTSEPGCAVRKAIESGELTEERLLSYKKLEAENSYSEDSKSYLASKEEKFKTISKINKGNRKKR